MSRIDLKPVLIGNTLKLRPAILSHEKERELDGKPFTQLYYRLAAPGSGGQ